MRAMLILCCVAAVYARDVEKVAVEDAKLINYGYSCLPTRYNIGPMRDGQEFRRYTEICDHLVCKEGVVHYDHNCHEDKHLENGSCDLSAPSPLQSHEKPKDVSGEDIAQSGETVKDEIGEEQEE